MPPPPVQRRAHAEEPQESPDRQCLDARCARLLFLTFLSADALHPWARTGPWLVSSSHGTATDLGGSYSGAGTRGAKKRHKGKQPKLPLGHRGVGHSTVCVCGLSGGSAKAGKTQEKPRRACPPHPLPLFPPLQRVLSEPQGLHHTESPTCRDGRFSAKQNPGVFLHPAASHQQEPQLVQNVNVLENKFRGFRSETSAHNSDRASPRSFLISPLQSPLQGAYPVRGNPSPCFSQA